MKFSPFLGSNGLVMRTAAKKVKGKEKHEPLLEDVYTLQFSALEECHHEFKIPVIVFMLVCEYLPMQQLPDMRSICIASYLGVKQLLQMSDKLNRRLSVYLNNKLETSEQSKKVTVCVRLKPVEGPFCVKTDRKRIIMDSCDYMFDHLFGARATQEEVFGKISKELFFSVARKENVCVFCYGQTGAGKTHTMFGNLKGDEDAQNEGVAFRVVNGITKESPFWSNETKSMTLTFMEVYNEKVHDLLGKTEKSLKTSVDTKGNFSVPDITHVEPTSPSDWKRYVRKGSQHRASGKTVFNERSSRSHAIATVHITWRNGKTSRVHLVDLAGSERSGKYALNDKSLTEGTYINKSLTTLARVVSAVAGGKGDHIPIRDSVLTQLISDSIAGKDNSKSFMLAAINPAKGAAKETTSTLHYAYQYSTLRSSLPRLISTCTQELRTSTRVVELKRAAYLKNLTELRLDAGKLEIMLKERRVRIKHSAEEVQAALAAMGMPWSGLYAKKCSSIGVVICTWKLGDTASAAYLVKFEDGKQRWYPAHCVVEERTFTLMRSQRDDLVKEENSLEKQASNLRYLKNKYAKLLESWQHE
eukprot:TRINITY_DN4328_c2_g1_i1.p1 TRINITY_DN4328_c2_g1~~TRINITY_DN4328_c2_g1_i1.p1  ORF type:complete len:586 (+),score=166.29 TRINITY_DN4328_c2_g1_i1:75-1832(+)